MGTLDAGAVTLDGGRSIITNLVSGGFEEIENGGDLGLGSFVPGPFDTGSSDFTLINGGEEMAETGYAAVGGGIEFIGTGGVLELGGTDLTTTTLSGFAPGDRIDLLYFGFTRGATATLGAHNVLTIQGLTGGTATLMLDPAANYHGAGFKLAGDGDGGTNLTVQGASMKAVPSLPLCTPRRWRRTIPSGCARPSPRLRPWRDARQRPPG